MPIKIKQLYQYEWQIHHSNIKSPSVLVCWESLIHPSALSIHKAGETEPTS